MFRALMMVLILCLADSAVLRAHGLFLVPQTVRVAENPEAFLRRVEQAATAYRSRTGRLPQRWEVLMPDLSATLSGREVIGGETLSATELVCAVDGGKKGEFRYHLGSGIPLVWSTNSAKADNWMIRTDVPGPVRYFPDEGAELKYLQNVHRKLSSKGIVAGVRNFFAENIFYSWRFYHPAAFDLLVGYAGDRDRTAFYRSQAVRAMKDTPHLYRFTDRIPRLRAIARELKEKPGSDEPEREKELAADIDELIRTIAAAR